MRSIALLGLLVAYFPTIFIQPFCGVLLWTWISIMNPHRVVWGIGSSLPYAMIVGSATIFSLMVSREPKLPPRSVVSFIFIAMMIEYSIATLFGLSPLAIPIWDRVMKELLFAIITLMLLSNKARLHAFIWVLILSLGFFGLKGGVFTILTGGSYRIYGPEHSYIYDNNHIALGLIMFLPFMNYLRLHSKWKVISIGMAVLLILSSMAALFTFSRGGILAFIAMSGLLWWRSRKKLVTTFIVAVGAIALFSLAPASLFDRWKTIANYEEDGSAMGRLAIWANGLKIVADRPLFGGGFRATYDANVLHRYAPGAETKAVHSSHLEILIENGVIGFLLHIGLIFATWRLAGQTLRAVRGRIELLWARDLAAMLQTSLAGYVVGGMFLSLGYYDGWYCLPIIAVALQRCVVDAARTGAEPAPGNDGVLAPPRPVLPKA